MANRPSRYQSKNCKRSFRMEVRRPMLIPLKVLLMNSPSMVAGDAEVADMEVDTADVAAGDTADAEAMDAEAMDAEAMDAEAMDAEAMDAEAGVVAGIPTYHVIRTTIPTITVTEIGSKNAEA